jgi:hypothetical protein
MQERLLKAVGPVHIVGGLLVFLSGFVPPAQQMLESLFAVAGGFVWSPFFVAILGPTIASWGVLFAAVVNQFFAAPTPGLWQAMLLSVLIWAPLDTALCLYFGLYGGAIVNAVVVIILLVLLFGVRELAYRAPR